jgi:hypothetical protein
MGLANHLVDAGVTVAVPSLFGEPGKPLSAGYALRKRRPAGHPGAEVSAGLIRDQRGTRRRWWVLAPYIARSARPIRSSAVSPGRPTATPTLTPMDSGP